MGIPFGWLKRPAWWAKAQAISDDANTVAHVYWRNGVLVDSKSNSWSQNGTVPQVAGRGFTPPGAGPWSDTNYYSLGAGADVLDFSAATGWYAAIVLDVGALSGSPVVFSDGFTNVNGYWLQVSGAQATFTTDAAATNSALGSGFPCVAGVNVICFGRTAAGVGFIKTNLRTVASVAMPNYAPDATNSAKIGRFTGGGSAFTSGTIYEAYFSSGVDPSDAIFTAIANSVKSVTKPANW